MASDGLSAATECSAHLRRLDHISGPARAGFVAGAVIVDCDTLQLVNLEKRITRTW